MRHLPNLDPLRFFLASAVIFFHIPELSKNQSLPYFDGLPIFHRGVDAVFMFFVLSGFLIIRTIYLDKRDSAFSIRKFYARRALRIFPLYYLVVVLGLLIYWVVLPKLDIPFQNNYTLGEDVMLLVFFAPNIFAELYKPGGILEILWSIGIEEQFYLLIAPLLFILRIRYIVVVLLILTLFSFMIFHFGTLSELKRFSYYFYFLFAGGIMALLEEEQKLTFLKSWKFFSILTVAFTIMYFFTDILKTQIFWLDQLIALVLFSCFVHTISFNNFGITIKNNVLIYFGKISYGIYMYHVIALNFVVFLFLHFEFLTNLPPELIILLIFSLTFGFSIAISHLSYRYYESYFLRLKQKFR